MPEITGTQINQIKAEGKYRYVRFLNGRCQAVKDAEKGPWETIELADEPSEVSMNLFLGQVLDLDSL